MNNDTTTQQFAASFDPTMPAVVITALTISDLAVVSEAHRWSTGQRGESVEADALAGCDLRPFVTQALSIGAQAITAAGGAQDTFDLERLIQDVGKRSAESSDKAAELTSKAATDAAELVKKAAAEARKAIGEADAATRKSMHDTVAVANKSLQGELHRIFGGESPELLDKLRPVLRTFGVELDARVSKQTTELLEKAARQFDPSDPTSPMAKHQRELQKQREALSATLVKQHEALTGKVDELTNAVKLTAAAQQAGARIASVTPLKGATYADGIHAVMQEIAAGLGDEYTDTGAVAGAIPGCKKGDGVLTVECGSTHVVLEMTDSRRRPSWNDYLDEAERNREAVASLGLVPDVAQNAGQVIRVLGSRRIVMVFDPASDEPDLLRTVVQLLRISAIAASSRRDAEGLQTAEERIGEAKGMLTKVDSIRKESGTIRKSADKIDGACNTVQTSIDRLLSQALDALRGAGSVADAAKTSAPAPSSSTDAA